MGVCNSIAEVAPGAIAKRSRGGVVYGEVQYNNIIEAITNLPQGNNVIAEYVWIDGQAMQKSELKSEGLRAKNRTLKIKKVTSLSQLPEWNFDGSSCFLAPTENSEIILKPVSYYPDPFKGQNNVIVMCECFRWKDKTYKELIPVGSNMRHFANKVFDIVKNEKVWYGIEQEYTLLKSKGDFECEVYGWPDRGALGAQGPYYCSVGGNVAFGREIADYHYKACLYAGIKISGTNAEVMPGQWEYQVGPAAGLEVGDHIWMSRYLLLKVAECQGLSISFDVKLFKDWNGSGAHTNFSTETMRKGTEGMPYIDKMMKKFAAKHKEHLMVYGEDNFKRLTGIHETSSMDKFSYGVGNRAASFRIPTQVMKDKGKGYIEDRRPGSNIDPYIVSAMIADTALIPAEQSVAPEMLSHFKAWMSEGR